MSVGVYVTTEMNDIGSEGFGGARTQSLSGPHLSSPGSSTLNRGVDFSNLELASELRLRFRCPNRVY